jgi:hypothetical protein
VPGLGRLRENWILWRLGRVAGDRVVALERLVSALST